MPRKPKDPTATAKDGSKRRGSRKPIGTGKAGINRGAGKLEVPLTEKQEAFIRLWMVRRNNTRAYAESHPGASYITANTEGSRLFHDPRISQRIKGLLEEESARLKSKAERVTENLAAMAFSSLADVYSQEGNLILPTDLPRDVALAVKKIKRREIIGKDADGKPAVIGHTVEVEMHEKTAALRLLGLEHGMFTEKVEHSMSDEQVLAALDRGRDRARAARKPG